MSLTHTGHHPCKHFIGLTSNPRCGAGVLYEEVTRRDKHGVIASLPCLPGTPYDKPDNTCPKFTHLTEDELRQREEETFRTFSMHMALNTPRCQKCRR